MRLAGQTYHRVGVLGRDEGGLVRAGIIHDDELPAVARKIAGHEGAQRLREYFRALVGGDDHREERSIGRHRPHFHSEAPTRPPFRARRAAAVQRLASA